jgi:hypothetical protein
MTPVLDEARSAAELFVDRLRPDDRARVGMFSTQTWMSHEFTANRDALLSWPSRDRPSRRHGVHRWVRYREPDVVGTAARARARPRWLRGPALVDQLASETGGGRVVLTPKEEMNRLFTTILNELHYLYLLGFAPQTPDGKVHELTVKLKDPKLVIRARQHYVAPQRSGTRH